MKKSILATSLAIAGLFAAGAVQAQAIQAPATQTVTVTPAFTYTTVTTAPFFVGSGADIPPGPDYPYPGAEVTAAAPPLITTPVRTTQYLPTPVMTLVAPATPAVASASDTTVLGAAPAGTVRYETVTTTSYPISIVSGPPLVIYQY